MKASEIFYFISIACGVGALICFIATYLIKPKREVSQLRWIPSEGKFYEAKDGEPWEEIGSEGDYIELPGSSGDYISEDQDVDVRVHGGWPDIQPFGLSPDTCPHCGKKLKGLSGETGPG